jgi:membrane associated rhomboid family serine protease
MIVVVALIALGMEFILLRRMANLKAEDALRVFAVTLILIGTLFFIAAGFDSTQIAPAMGLFGTVAGYLLGKSIDRKESKESE